MLQVAIGCRGRFPPPEPWFEKPAPPKKVKRDIKKDFGYDFECMIILDEPKICSLEAIQGKFVVLDAPEKNHQGVRIQFEGRVTVQTSNRGSTPDQSIQIKTLEQELTPGAIKLIRAGNAFTFSPVGVQISGISFSNFESDESTTHTLEEGCSSFPFTFQMTGEPLPAPFKRKEWSLEYQLVAYFREGKYFIKMASLPVSFRGHRSLCRELKAPSRPLCHKYYVKVKTSAFSSANIIKIELTSEESEFLPGQEIPFHLKVFSTKMTTVSTAKLVLSRKTVYSIKGIKKIGIVVVDTFETHEMIKDKGCSWILGFLRLPDRSIPTFKENDVYNVSYFLEYEVKVEQHSTLIKNQIEITIGTSPGSSEMEFPSTNNNDRSLRRSSSIESRLSEVSFLTLPPAYSQLSSRAGSIVSLETLPPHYEDISELE